MHHMSMSGAVSTGNFNAGPDTFVAAEDLGSILAPLQHDLDTSRAQVAFYPSLFAAALDPPRQLRNAGRLEQHLHTQLYTQHPAHPRDHLHRQQRVAAQREEVLIPPDPRQAQHLAPDAAQ